MLLCHHTAVFFVMAQRNIPVNLSWPLNNRPLSLSGIVQFNIIMIYRFSYEHFVLSDYFEARCYLH